MIYHLAVCQTDGTANRTSFLVHPCCILERPRTECVAFAYLVLLDPVHQVSEEERNACLEHLGHNVT